MKGLKDMKATLRRHRLPMPVIPAGLQTRVEKLRDWAWGSRAEVFPLYDIQSWVAEAAEAQPEDYFLLGQDGYGTNAWYLHCYVSVGPVSIFIQAPWGGAYTELKAALDGIQRRYAVLERLLQTAEKASLSGATLPGRLVIQQSSVLPPRWAWVVAGAPVQWQEEFANAMTPALESLQAVLTRQTLE